MLVLLQEVLKQFGVGWLFSIPLTVTDVQQKTLSALRGGKSTGTIRLSTTMITKMTTMKD